MDHHHGALVKRLRHRPFTAATWVRIPYASPLPITEPSDWIYPQFVIGHERETNRCGTFSESYFVKIYLRDMKRMRSQLPIMPNSQAKPKFVSESSGSAKRNKVRGTNRRDGRLAQLGERLPYKQNVGSSILSSPTRNQDLLAQVFFISLPSFAL